MGKNKRELNPMDSYRKQQKKKEIKKMKRDKEKAKEEKEKNLSIEKKTPEILRKEIQELSAQEKKRPLSIVEKRRKKELQSKLGDIQRKQLRGETTLVHSSNMNYAMSRDHIDLNQKKDTPPHPSNPILVDYIGLHPLAPPLPNVQRLVPPPPPPPRQYSSFSRIPYRHNQLEIEETRNPIGMSQQNPLSTHINKLKRESLVESSKHEVPETPMIRADLGAGHVKNANGSYMSPTISTVEPNIGPMMGPAMGPSIESEETPMGASEQNHSFFNNNIHQISRSRQEPQREIISEAMKSLLPSALRSARSIRKVSSKRAETIKPAPRPNNALNVTSLPSNTSSGATKEHVTEEYKKFISELKDLGAL